MTTLFTPRPSTHIKSNNANISINYEYHRKNQHMNNVATLKT